MIWHLLNPLTGAGFFESVLQIVTALKKSVVLKIEPHLLNLHPIRKRVPGTYQLYLPQQPILQELAIE